MQNKSKLLNTKIKMNDPQKARKKIVVNIRMFSKMKVLSLSF